MTGCTMSGPTRSATFIRAAMVEKGLRPALAGFRGTAPWRNQWARRTNNWNFVCNSGITMGALAIAEDEPGVGQRADP